MQIAVIGGGIIGCAAAWRLAQAGARVTVFDRGRIGAEASWAGAGMLAPGGEFGTDSPWARRGVESLAMYPEFLAELSAASGLEIDFRVCGALERADSEAEAAEVASRVARQRQMGITVEETRPPEGAVAAWWYPDEAAVNPREVVAALQRAGEREGVEFREHEEIADPEEAPGEAVVRATGAWAPHAYPVKGHLVSYAMPPGSLSSILRRGHYYILQRRNGLTLAGADMELAGFDRRVRPEAVAAIREAAETMLPALRATPVVESWMGFRPGSETGEPVVGRVAETRVWDAYGHFRNGILLAPVTARLLVSGILGG